MFVYLCVCLSACLSASISPELHTNFCQFHYYYFCLFYSWSWLSPSLAALRYVIFGLAECDFYEITIALFCRAAVEQLSV